MNLTELTMILITSKRQIIFQTSILKTLRTLLILHTNTYDVDNNNDANNAKHTRTIHTHDTRDTDIKTNTNNIT